MKLIDLIGIRFERLLVVKRAENGRCGRSRWKCLCDCGNFVIHFSTNLKNGKSTSCGCLKKEKCKKNATIHGHSKSKVYSIWAGMIERCENLNSKAYKNYGGRGISVCKEWRGSFEVFYRDMGDPPFGLTLDRINNDEGYLPGNCRWANWVTQNNNRRNSKGLNRDNTRS